MARTIPENYGDERHRLSVFVRALREMEPDESVAVGVSILDDTHVVTGEKTEYGHVFVQVHETGMQTLLAEEYDIGSDGTEPRFAVADALATATERYVRLRSPPVSQINVEDLPKRSD